MKNYEMFVDMLQVISALALIIGLIILLLRFLSKKSRMLNAGRGIQHLGGIQLGQNKSLQVIEIGSYIYIIGVGENIQLIDKLKEPELVALMKEHMADSSSLSASSFNKLKSMIKQSKQDSHHLNETDEASVSFQEMFFEKVSKIQNRKKQNLEEWIKQEDQNEKR